MIEYVPVIGNSRGFAEFCNEMCERYYERDIEFRLTMTRLEIENKCYFLVSDVWGVRGKRFSEYYFVSGYLDLNDIDKISDEVEMRLAYSKQSPPQKEET